MSIYSWTESNNNFFRKKVCPFVCMSIYLSVCPSVCPFGKLLYTKTWENLERKTKLPTFQTDRTKSICLSDFAISWDLTYEINSFFFNFKENNTTPDWTRFHEVCRSWSRMKVVLSCYPYEIQNLIFLSVKNVDRKSTLSNFEPDHTKIVKVRAEWNCYQS